jgi:acetyl-CoA C-acetyltransferase
VKGKKGDVVIAADEHPRDGANMASMAKLPPVFKSAAEGGSVHAGNSSGVTDGAAALVLMTDVEAKRRGLEILATIGPWAQAGVAAKTMGIGPVAAFHKLAKQTDRKIDDYGLIELNEAFAAQVIACDRELKIPADRLNVNGGAIAIGHPIGATGARIVVTLLHEMKRRGDKRGLATLCISGGLGLAAEFTRE